LVQGIRGQIWELRERGSGPARIALTLGISHSSVHRLLLRQGRNRLLGFDGLMRVERRQAYSQQAQL
jgi:predicted transcriptional regulator